MQLISHLRTALFARDFGTATGALAQPPLSHVV